MAKAKKPAFRFPDRVRFNWGFHQAQLEMADELPMSDGGRAALRHNHFDPMWAAGYRWGARYFQRDGVRQESSDFAWDAHTYQPQD